jgi:hypothetical protein
MTPSKTIQLTNNGPAITTSSFLQLPNDHPVHFEQLHIPTTTASTGLQADDDCHSILNGVIAPTTTVSTGLQANNDCHSILKDVPSPQTFSTLTATRTATLTQVLAITTLIMKATQNKLDKSFLYPTKSGVNNATKKSENLLLHIESGSAITTALNAQNLLLLSV